MNLYGEGLFANEAACYTFIYCNATHTLGVLTLTIWFWIQTPHKQGVKSVPASLWTKDLYLTAYT